MLGLNPWLLAIRHSNHSARSVLWIRIRIILVTWIRIRIRIKFKNPDPYPHQIKIRIRSRIKVISWIQNWIRIHINLQMTRKNVMKYSLISAILALFQGFEPLFESYDPDPQGNKSNPDPHQSDADPQILGQILIRNYRPVLPERRALRRRAWRHSCCSPRQRRHRVRPASPRTRTRPRSPADTSAWTLAFLVPLQ